MPNPGSPEAMRLGCICPVLDNNYGAGAIIEGHVDPTQFYTTPGCPMHVDRRVLDAEPRGEIHSGGDAEHNHLPGDSSVAYLVPAVPADPVSEVADGEQLPRTSEGSLGSSEVRGEAKA